MKEVRDSCVLGNDNSKNVKFITFGSPSFKKLRRQYNRFIIYSFPVSLSSSSVALAKIRHSRKAEKYQKGESAELHTAGEVKYRGALARVRLVDGFSRVETSSGDSKSLSSSSSRVDSGLGILARTRCKKASFFIASFLNWKRSVAAKPLMFVINIHFAHTEVRTFPNFSQFNTLSR